MLTYFDSLCGDLQEIEESALQKELSHNVDNESLAEMSYFPNPVADNRTKDPVVGSEYESFFHETS